MSNFKEFENPWSADNSEWFGEEKDKWFDNEWSKETPVLNNQKEQKIKSGSVLICYGLGASLGNFEIFAKALKTNHLTKEYESDNIKIEKTQNRLQLLSTIINSGLLDLKEIHIFSHSFGAGLALGYGDTTAGQARANLITNKPEYDYNDVVNTETATLLTDHLILLPENEKKDLLVAVKELDFIKLWGCNAGVSNWVYSGDYWKKLNDENTPKPSIAQAMADFFQKSVYGAESGSHIQYFIDEKWVSGYDYKKRTGKEYPSNKEFSDIRLHPDKGNYYNYSPKK